MKNLFKPQIIRSLTPHVKLLSEGLQLQGFRCLRNSSGETLYELKCFPGPKKGYLLGLFGSEGDLALLPLESTELSQAARVGFDVANDPVQLYVRAHVVNQRLLEETGSVGESRLLICWRFQGATFCFEGEHSAQAASSLWSVVVEREGSKTFRRQVRMAKFPDESTETRKEEVLEKRENFLQSKDERLLSRVQNDIDESRDGFERLNLLCSFLDSNPDAWGGEWDEWPEGPKDSLEWLRSQGKTPGFQRSFRADAFEIIHGARKRFQRKLLGAQKRLSELNQKMEQGLHVTGEASKKKLQQQAGATHAHREKAQTGLWLIHPSGLKMRLGRNRKENAELFRQASSRDLWFHVRGLGGGHVWVPRGQPLFGAKADSLREDLLIWAAQLAIYNSKARNSGYGAVDYTEKRYLKSAKGEEGTVLIQRSQSQLVELSSEFESWLRNHFKSS